MKIFSFYFVSRVGQHLFTIGFFNCRVLIAYQSGVIILWDISEDKAIHVRGHEDFQLKDDIVISSTSDIRHDKLNNKSNEDQIEKEISALCWVSSDGSTLAVGYVDGDIILWNLPTAISTNNPKANKSASNAVKLSLSSGDRRLPVIVLHWSNSPHSGSAGQLFIYGGDDIGSEEVLTVSKCITQLFFLNRNYFIVT